MSSLQIIRDKLMFRSKLKSPATKTGGSSRSSSNNNVKIDIMRSKLNFKDEYMETFRTKSYTDIWSKVQCQLRRTTILSDDANDADGDKLIFPINNTTRNIPSYTHILSHFLLEPHQEILINIIQTSNLHYLLIDYFQASLEACNICGSLLQCIDQTRANYCIIQRVIKLTKRVSNSEDQFRFIFGELASFAKLDNPLSSSKQLQFSIIHDRYGLMLNQLTAKRKKIGKRVKVISLCKKAWGVSLIMVCSGLAIATVVLAVHSLVGIVAAPGLISFQLGFLRRRIKSLQNGGLKKSNLMKFHAQLDAASKGVYTLNKDFDTMSRLVMRLHDEIEHSKSIAEWCVKIQKKQMLKEVVKEFQTQESCFLEKLGELEEHVYLCVLTINRARRLVIQEINRTRS